MSKQTGSTVKQRSNKLDRAAADLGLHKAAKHLAWLVRNNKARHDSRMESAIQNWESDLDYLRHTHYRQEFPWPMTDVR